MTVQPSAAGADFATGLDALARLAGELGASAIEADAQALATRVLEGRFFVACIGQFKRGKSSLVNALVGASILPTGVAPVTSVVTIVRYGATSEARITLANGSVTVPTTDLLAYVSEQGNPSNAKRVRAVEVFVPSELLRSGMCLVDTPGIGSVIGANTEATSAFVPRIDAALVVLGADPPISGDELELVATVAAEVDTLLFVLSKADRFTDADRQEARAFTERVLYERLRKAPGPLFEVSTVERLAGAAETRDWRALVTTLAGLAAESRDRLVGRAAVRGTKQLTAALLRDIDERVGALERPIAESERRISSLRASKLAAEQSLRDLHHLMTAEQERLTTHLRARQKAFLAVVIPTAALTLDQHVATLKLGRGPRRRGALERAQELYHELVDRWRAEEQPTAERSYEEGVDRFVTLANSTVRDIMQAVDTDSPLLESPMGKGFRVRSQLRYTELLYMTGRSPLRWLTDQLLPPGVARRAVVREALHYLHRLLETNASRVTNDLDEQARESRSRLEKEIGRQLENICTTAEQALASAQVQRARGESAVASELQRLRAKRTQVSSLIPDSSPD